MKRYYWALRGYVFAFGVILIFAVFGSHFVVPELYYDTGPVPPLSDRLFSIAGGLACAAVLLLPHRWTVHGWRYYVKLALLSAMSILIAVVAAVMIISFFEGGRDWLIIPAALALLVLALGAPATLILRKRQVST